MKAIVKHVKKLQFSAVSDSNHAIIIDANKKLSYDQGTRPMELLLIGLAGCTGMDVVSLLGKMRIDFSDFSVTAEADTTQGHPLIFKKIHLTFFISGKSIDEKKLNKAIDLSQNRYCGATAMLRKSATITYSFVINEKI